jgi:hypothetical protein
MIHVSVSNRDMPERSEYAFPLYHRIGKAIQPVIRSKYWLLIVIGLAILLYLPLLFSGFYTDDLGHRLSFSPEAAERLGWLPEMAPAWWNLYGFSTHSEGYFPMLLDQGFFYPWWASDTIRVSFLRPLASATLAFDFSLWPNTPLPIHIHSLLWFLLLIFLVFRLYKDLTGSVTVAGLGILLIVLDDVFASPAGWISNRHALIAMVFGVLCLILYHRGVRQKSWGLIGGSYALMAVALLASEMGLVTFAYLFAHMLILDDDRWGKRILRIVPFVVIIVVWRVIYSAMGYGVQGSTLYVDPVTNPALFISSMITRLPINLFTAIGLPIAGLTIAAAPQAMVWIAAFCAGAVVLYAAMVFPVLRKHRLAAFWLIGLLCALVPLSAGIPGNRNLGFVSLGLMGLVSQLFVDAARMKKSDLPGLGRALLKVHLPVLVILYMVISPILILSQSATWRVTTETQKLSVAFGDDPALADQHVYIVNPPGVALYTVGTFWKVFTDEPIPKSINYLSPGFTTVEIRRVDERTIHVVPKGGYTPSPGIVIDPTSGAPTPIGLENVYRAIDRSFYYDPNHLTEVGQTVELSEFTVEVAKMTDDGRIAEANFTFAEPLESDQYRWLVWDADSESYKMVEMPPVGESRVYP